MYIPIGFSIRLSILLLFIVGCLLACNKQSALNERDTETFFNREVSSNVLKYETESDDALVDTIITQLKIGNRKTNFAKIIIDKFGVPKWNNAIFFKNANSLKTVFIPIVGEGNSIKIAIMAYQSSPNYIKYKFIKRSGPIGQLPKYGDDKKTVFTQQTFLGIFQAFDKALGQQLSVREVSPNSASIRPLQTLVYTYCWSYSIMYSNGDISVGNTQCSSHIIIRPDFPTTTPEEWQIPQPPDSGGNSEATNKDIIDSLNGYPCAQQILKEIPDLNNVTKEILRDIFSVNDEVNIRFSPSTNIESGTAGKTGRCGPEGSYFNCEILLSASMLQNATKDYIVATMIHEVLHAVIRFDRARLSPSEFATKYPIFNQSGAGSSHNIMAENLVNKMASILQAYNPSLLSSTAEALAFGGLQETTKWSERGDTNNLKQINFEARNPQYFTNNYNFKKCP